MFGSNFHGLAPERGLRRAFGPTNLLTSLRSGLRPSLREELIRSCRLCVVTNDNIGRARVQSMQKRQTSEKQSSQQKFIEG